MASIVSVISGISLTAGSFEGQYLFLRLLSWFFFAYDFSAILLYKGWFSLYLSWLGTREIPSPLGWHILSVLENSVHYLFQITSGQFFLFSPYSNSNVRYFCVYRSPNHLLLSLFSFISMLQLDVFYLSSDMANLLSYLSNEFQILDIFPFLNST